MKTLSNYFEKLLSSKVVWETSVRGIVNTDDLSDIWIEMEDSLDKEVEQKRFFRYDNPERIEQIKRYAKEIKNYYTGGDDDFIIFDIERGEYTYGECGEGFLGNVDVLEKHYKDKNLSEILKSNYKCK